MKQLIPGKQVVITGGARGIGLAIARLFAEEGASLALLGTNKERGNQAVEELRPLLNEGEKVVFYQTNVADEEQMGACFQEIYKDFGKIDALVNNAGITRDNLLMKMSSSEWKEVLVTNLDAIFLACKAVIRPMIKARSGKIINISSVVGLSGNAGQSNYAASKAGMLGFTKSLAQEVASRGIQVNAIAPGFIETDMTGALNEKQKEMILAQIPMQRLGQGSDIAKAALFLASPLSDYITGQVLTVDGGMVMA